MQAVDLRSLIRDVLDFPEPGIVFKDITPLLRDPEALRLACRQMAAPFRAGPVDLVVGVESRGFIFGPPVALELGVGFAIARKPGKLPGETIAHTYDLEYGSDTVEIQADAIHGGQRVAVLHGPLLEPVPSDRPIDWVVSNPPYIPTRDLDGLEPEVSRWESRVALDGGQDGLDIYRALVPAAASRARLGVLVEVGIEQAGKVADLFRQAGLIGIETFDDLEGIPRVVGARTAG